MRRLAVWFGLVCLLAAAPANAGTISVDFDLSGSSISILGGIVTIPPNGSITTASASVAVPGSSIVNPQAGAAALSDLTIDGTISGTVAALVTLSGSIAGTQVGVANGSLTGGLANVVIGTLSLNLSAFVACIPPATCALVGTFPISIMSTQVITGVGTIGVGNLATSGAATLNAVLSITIDGNSAVVNLVGTEVSRTFAVPEPDTFGLVGLGLLGLAGVGWRRTRGH